MKIWLHCFTQVSTLFCQEQDILEKKIWLKKKTVFRWSELDRPIPWSIPWLKFPIEQSVKSAVNTFRLSKKTKNKFLVPARFIF